MHNIRTTVVRRQARFSVRPHLQQQQSNRSAGVYSTLGPAPGRPLSANSHQTRPASVSGAKNGQRALNTSSVRFRIIASMVASLPSCSAIRCSSSAPRAGTGASDPATLAAAEASTVVWQ